MEKQTTDASQDTIIFLDDSLPSSQIEVMLKEKEEDGALRNQVGNVHHQDLALDVDNSSRTTITKRKCSVVDEIRKGSDIVQATEGSPDMFDVPSGSEDNGILTETEDKDLYVPAYEKEPNSSPVGSEVWLPKKSNFGYLDDPRKAATTSLASKANPDAISTLSPIMKESKVLTSAKQSDLCGSGIDFEHPELLSFLRENGVLEVYPPAMQRLREKSPDAKIRRVQVDVQYSSTPLPETGILIKRVKDLGSHVKVVKTTNVTPVPSYELMTDKELKVSQFRIFRSFYTVLSTRFFFGGGRGRRDGGH